MGLCVPAVQTMLCMKLTPRLKAKGTAGQGELSYPGNIKIKVCKPSFIQMQV